MLRASLQKQSITAKFESRSVQSNLCKVKNWLDETPDTFSVCDSVVEPSVCSTSVSSDFSHWLKKQL